MIPVAIDIEATGRSSASVFLVAMAAQIGETRIKKLFYFPEAGMNYRSTDTIAWWNSDPERKKFLEKSLSYAQAHATRKTSATEIRVFVDWLYGVAEAKGEELVMFSDFTVFDIGMVNSILETYGLLPIYLKDDSSPPCECTDFTTHVKGLAGLSSNASSNAAFAKLGIVRKPMSQSHDTDIDIEIILDNILAIEAHVSKISNV